MDVSSLQRIKQRYSIVGNCETLNLAIETALKVAPVDLNVLIVGENGVGKEVFPRIIHDHSLRKTKKYIAINCGSIPEGTIDSELFGHEKGSFTGAIDDREGYFAVANGGTLFLDEVGELPLSTQARLLRVLETGEYIKVGSSKVQKTDVRIVAATNVNMADAIATGKFRQDLYYRLNTIPISIPPLRERGEDIALLFRKFALDMSEKYHFPSIRLTPKATERLLFYSWPGNVRQLKNIAENISVTSETREIDDETLAKYLPKDINASRSLVPVAKSEKSERMFENEREILYQILFDLRRDVTELKKIVNGQHPATVVPVEGGVTLYRDAALRSAHKTSDIEDDVYTEEALSMDEMERGVIQKALDRNQWHKKNAADELGISTRTLARKIKEYGLQ